MDIIGKIMHELGDFDKGLAALAQARQHMPEHLHPKFDIFVGCYLDDAAERLAPETQEEHDRVIADCEGVMQVLSIANAYDQEHGTEIFMILVAYAMVMTRSNFGHSPWRRVVAVIEEAKANVEALERAA